MKRVIQQVQFTFNEHGECQGVIVTAQHTLEHPEAPGGRIEQMDRKVYNRENIGAIPGALNVTEDVLQVVSAPLLNS